MKNFIFLFKGNLYQKHDILLITILLHKLFY
jgi:hypothetical protein